MSVSVVSELERKSVRRNQIKLLGIFAVALLPLLLAVLMYFGGFAVPKGHTNHGELVVPPLSVSLLGPEPLEYLEQNRTWQLMLVGQGECADNCSQWLHTMRQVHILMGREMDRVSRMFVGTQSVGEGLKDSYPNLTVLKTNETLIQDFNDSDSAPSDTWQLWLVDPLGNAMLRYDHRHTGYDIKDDLKKLLKLSKIG